MVWIRCRIVVRQVTADTGSRNSGITIRMTTDTGYANMCSGKREGGSRIVVESRRTPCCYIMTGNTVCREFSLYMIRIRGSVIIR